MLAGAFVGGPGEALGNHRAAVCQSLALAGTMLRVLGMPYVFATGYGSAGVEPHIVAAASAGIAVY